MAFTATKGPPGDTGAMETSPLAPPPNELAAHFADLRGFVDRRIAELSAELHATVQMVDYSEANLSGQPGRIHEQIAGLVAIPAASTRNSGVELEAVVQATEVAANTIMEAAEAIQVWIATGAQDPAALQALSERCIRSSRPVVSRT